MKKVILTKGLPASGKTTWAKSVLNNNKGSYKIVCKDDLRAMLDDGHYTKDNEKFILKIRDIIILEALDAGKHIIVADTNLSDEHYQHIKELVKNKALVSIKDFTDVDIEICINRDLKRFNSVGKDVILSMYNKFLKPSNIIYNSDLINVIICDLDGTLALLNGRNPYDASTCENDLINIPVLDMVKDKEVIYVSGRSDKYREQTLKFLDKHNLKFELLLMRKNGDNRKDSIIKKEIFNNYIKDKYNVSYVIDDRPSVIRMWRSLGLKVIDVGDGIEF